MRPEEESEGKPTPEINDRTDHRTGSANTNPMAKPDLGKYRQVDRDVYIKFWPEHDPEIIDAALVGIGEPNEWPCRWMKSTVKQWVNKAGHPVTEEAVCTWKKGIESYEKAKSNGHSTNRRGGIAF
jgi:hypothetical protein